METEELQRKIEQLEAKIDAGTSSEGAGLLYRQLLAVLRGRK